MASNMMTLIRAGAAILNESLQGKKRWISLLAYLMLAISTVAGFQLDALARDLALDPAINKESTLIAIATAAGVTFRFFQSVGRNRELSKQVDALEDRLDRKGIR
tara:strand:- start:379 stop:693 length:315 start_codon:yes stop_codon:yes gene_type:complete